MSKIKTGSVLGDIPKPSLEKSATKILEHGAFVVVNFGFFRGKKKIVLGVQSTENSWLDCAPVYSFNGFVRMEDGIFPCVGIRAGEETIISILM